MMEFCLLDIIKYYFKNIYIVFICVLLFFIGGLIYTDKYMEYKYESSTLILVGSCSYDCNIFSYDDLELANGLIKNYLELIKSKKVIQLVIEELKLENSYEEIKDMINVSNEDDSYFINISVISNDKKLSCLIANVLVEKLSFVTKDIYKVDNIYVINSAIISNDAVHSKIYYLVLFMLCGFIFSSLLILFVFCGDEKVICNTINRIMGINVLEYIKYNKKIDYNLNGFNNLKNKLLNESDKIYLFSCVDKSDINYLLINISISLSMDKKKILIIDDIGVLTKKLKLNNKLGLDDYFSKRMNINNIVCSVDKYDIIPKGNCNKKEILNYDKFNRVIQLLEKEYDYIFISSKKIEYLKISKLNVIFVCTEYMTRLKNILKYKRRIEESKIKMKDFIVYR